METIILQFPNQKPPLSVEGVMHGPYPDIPADMLKRYVETRELRGFPMDQSEEQFIADRQTEWQYDQHLEALLTALEAGRIAVRAFERLEHNIRPWWIGWRNPGEYEQASAVEE